MNRDRHMLGLDVDLEVREKGEERSGRREQRGARRGVGGKGGAGGGERRGRGEGKRRRGGGVSEGVGGGPGRPLLHKICRNRSTVPIAAAGSDASRARVELPGR